MIHNSVLETRGIVLTPHDLSSIDWVGPAKEAGITTLATHGSPSQIIEYIQSEPGQEFLDGCRREDIQVEHVMHAISDLLPRELFERNKNMFRMDEKGERVPDDNLCIHSQMALEVIKANVVEITQRLPSTTGRYFYYIDDMRPMCRCPKCRYLSDSDQALILEHQLLDAVRTEDPRATIAHLAYGRTKNPPQQIKPEPGIFLEYAPIERSHEVPLSNLIGLDGIRWEILHSDLLDMLDANLALFGAQNAQVLEYWLDVSRFAYWKRENIHKLSWRPDVFREDLNIYASRGIKHITSFGVWIDADYVEKYGLPPIKDYGQTLSGIISG